MPPAAESPSMALAKGKSKATTKKAATKKAVTKSTAKQGKVVPIDDAIVNVSMKCEKMKKAEAFAAVPKLLESVDETYFELGGTLSVIQSNGWFHDDGYHTFAAFVETEFGIAQRKAYRLIGIYNHLVDADVPWEKVHVLGWTKLSYLASELTVDNVDKWVTDASSMTVLQLVEFIKQSKKGTLPKTGETHEETGETAEAEAKTITTMTLKVYEDQKEVIKEAIDKAKSEADTEYDSVAIEAICLNYISGGSKVPKAKTLNAMMKDSTWEEVLEEFEKIWPDINLSVEV